MNPSTEPQVPERRVSQRVRANFMLSYRVLDKTDAYDISLTRDISLRGALFTTRSRCEPGTTIVLKIKLPFEQGVTLLISKVIDSIGLSGIIFNTRVEFLSVGEDQKALLMKALNNAYYHSDNLFSQKPKYYGSYFGRKRHLFF
jgi:hypothetical protein